MAGKFTDVPQALRRNFRLLYAVNFFSTAQFILPIYILFGTHYLHLSYLGAGSFFLLSWVLSLGLDFLGGVLADKFGRKKVFVLGMLLQIIGYAPFVVFKNYPLLLVASVLQGLGLALFTNTVEALIYEQSKELKQLDYYQHANATTYAFAFAGRIVASIIGGIAYSVHPTLPYGLTVLALIAALFAGLGMRFNPRVEVQAEQEMRNGISTAALKLYACNKGLLKFALIAGLGTLWADFLFIYYQPLYIQFHVSALSLGIVFSAISLFSAGGSLIMRKLPNKFSAHGINTLDIVSIILSAGLLYTLKLPIMYIAPLVMAVGSGFWLPNLTLYINKHAPDRIRSSALSLATTSLGIGTAVATLLALSMAGHQPPRIILGIIIVGSALTLVANFVIRPQET